MHMLRGVQNLQGTGADFKSWRHQFKRGQHPENSENDYDYENKTA